MVILGLIHGNLCSDLASVGARAPLLDHQIDPSRTVVMNLDNLAERLGPRPAPHPSSDCLISYIVGYWPTMAVTGNGESGFDSGEGA